MNVQKIIIHCINNVIHRDILIKEGRYILVCISFYLCSSLRLSDIR